MNNPRKNCQSRFLPIRGFRKAMLVLTTAAGIAASPSSYADSTRIGTDPLSDAEASRVWNAALQGRVSSASAKSSTLQSTSRSTSDSVPTTTGAPNEPVVLLVERRLQEKGQAEPDRLANVYAYDYSDDSVMHTIVDAETGEVRHREILRNVQLPLIESEIQRAAGIFRADPVAWPLLQRAYREVTGAELQDISEIDFKAFIFIADTMPVEKVKDSVVCGAHRCAQMITYTRDNISLDVSPIIDLSTGRVSQVPGR